MASPLREMRSLAAPGTRSSQGMLTSTVWPARKVLPVRTVSVVGSSRALVAGRPPIVTWPVSSFDAAGAERGPLGHSRNTRRSVSMSGVNRTRKWPATEPSAGLTSARSVYFGRAGSGAARAGIVGQEGAVAGASVDVVVGATAVVEVGATPRLADGTESPVVQPLMARASTSGSARLIMGPCCQP